MIERAILVAGVLLVSVYTFTPREDAGEADRSQVETQARGNGASSLGDRRQLALARNVESYSAGGQTSLPRMGDGHFYADIRVNGATSRFLIDTGASVVALTRADAEAAGLDWDESEIRAIGSGASGTVYGVPVVLEEVSMEGHEARSVAAVIIPEGLEISLLGQSFLGKIDAISVRGDEMILGE